MTVSQGLEVVASNLNAETGIAIVEKVVSYVDMNFAEKIGHGMVNLFSNTFSGNWGAAGDAAVAVGQGMLPVMGSVAAITASGGLTYLSFQHFKASAVNTAKDMQLLAFLDKLVFFESGQETVVGVFDGGGSGSDGPESMAARIWVLRSGDSYRMVDQAQLETGAIYTGGIRRKLSDVFNTPDSLVAILEEMTAKYKDADLTEVAQSKRKDLLQLVTRLSLLSDDDRKAMDCYAEDVEKLNVRLRSEKLRADIETGEHAVTKTRRVLDVRKYKDVAQKLSEENVQINADLVEARKTVEVLSVQVKDLSKIATANVEQMLADADDIYRATYEELERLEARLETLTNNPSMTEPTTAHIDIDEPVVDDDESSAA